MTLIDITTSSSSASTITSPRLRTLSNKISSTMMLDDDDNNDNSHILQSRLRNIQTTIHKATRDAWKQQQQAAVSLEEEDNASFLLGMDLFGQAPDILEQGIRDKLEQVESELQRVLLLSTASSEQQQQQQDENMPLQQQQQDMEARVQAYQNQVAFLKQASLTRSALETSATLASAALTAEPNVTESSQHLMLAKDHLEDAERLLLTMSKQEQAVGRQILQGLQHAIRRQRVELLHQASSVLDSSIQIGAQELSVKSSSHLQEAFQVLETLQGGPRVLDETMRRLTRRLFDTALSPLLQVFRTTTSTTTTTNNKTLSAWKVVETENQPTKRMIGVSTTTSSTTKRGVVHKLEWRRCDEVEDSTTTTATATLDWPVGAWKDTLQVLQTILVFVQTKVLLERDRLCELVGTKLFGKPAALPSQLHLTALGLESTLLGDDKGLLMEELVELMAKTCLPDQLDAEHVTTLLPARGNELLKACVPFCKELVDRKLLLREPTPKLIAFCTNFAEKYVEHRRCVLLNQARDILRNHDYHNTVLVGVDEDNVKQDAGLSIFVLHKSSISEIASQIMALLRQTMQESVQMPTEPATLRPALYKTAREMLTLFRAIIPASHGHEVATVPRTAAVLHNDCIYLAHHCLTLGLEFKEQYNEEDARGKLLHQSCIFVDMVPLFRELADQSLGDMLDVQADQLVEVVGSRITHLGPALQSNTSRQEWSEAETALAAGIYHLRHLAQSWRPILSKRMFAQSMGHLADVILTLFWNQVTPKKQVYLISPNARHFLLGLFRKAAHDLQELFVDPQPERCIEDCSSEWDRFQALLHFLDISSSLAQVQAALASGVFRKVAGPELAQWIQAVHHHDQVESPERRALLQQLAGL